MRYIPSFLIIAVFTGCASLNTGWYKPGMSQQEFAEDKYDCMSKSQMQVSGAYVNSYAGAASSQTTTNMPLFQACMQAHGYVWTNQAAVEKYEAANPEPGHSSSNYSASTYTPADDWYNRYQACIRRFPVTNSSDQAASISARCKANTEAAP